MDGKTAITYVRYRDEDGDIGRIERQQKFMKAVMDQVMSPSIIPRLPNIIREVMGSVETDLSFRQCLELAGALKEVVDFDCGLSVDMSGLFDELFECCKRAGIDHPNCLEQSLGVMGKTEMLPDSTVFDISVMCGHGQISEGMIDLYVEKIKAGEKIYDHDAVRIINLWKESISEGNKCQKQM